MKTIETKPKLYDTAWVGSRAKSPKKSKKVSPKKSKKSITVSAKKSSPKPNKLQKSLQSRKV